MNIEPVYDKGTNIGGYKVSDIACCKDVVGGNVYGLLVNVIKRLVQVIKDMETGKAIAVVDSVVGDPDLKDRLVPVLKHCTQCGHVCDNQYWHDEFKRQKQTKIEHLPADKK